MLNYLAGGLRWRGTSVAEDEPLCLSTLTGLAMEEIVKVPPEENEEVLVSESESVSTGHFLDRTQNERKRLPVGTINVPGSI
jgi:hypothetical protein